MIYTEKMIPTKTIQLTIEEESLEAFKELLRRGCNTWQQMPQEIRELKDTILPPTEMPHAK